MKITTSQLRKMIKEEIIKELLSQEQLDEGVMGDLGKMTTNFFKKSNQLAKKGLKTVAPTSTTDLAVLLAIAGLTGTLSTTMHLHAVNQDKIQQTLAAASPQDLAKAQRALKRWFAKDGVHATIENAEDWIEHHKKAGTAGFGDNTDAKDFTP